jgi:formiminotetrahydrofolate cyclodeaminase
MTFWNATLAEFRAQVASNAPTPGGGSVASVCAALGMGLLQMALEITRRAATDDVATLDAWLAEARELSTRLVAHADRDADVFRAYMAALALARGTDDEKRARKQALAGAALAAAEAPLAATADMLAGLSLAEKALPRVKASVASDVLGGADLLGGSIAAALRNVDINLPALGSDDVRERMRSAREDAANRASESLARLATASAGSSR